MKPGNPGVLKSSTAELQDNWVWRSNPRKTLLGVALVSIKDRRVADSSLSIFFHRKTPPFPVVQNIVQY